MSLTSAAAPRRRGLFLNTARARCSIHESGRMVFEALQPAPHFTLDYQEVDFRHRRIPGGYDFYVVNYHDSTSMSWLDTRSVRRLPGPTIAIVLEVAPNDPFARVSPRDFDAYLVLDPTVTRRPRVYPFPRPLEPAPPLDGGPPPGRPTIGTFGLPTPGKGFDRLVDAVNREFDQAVVRRNSPPGDYVPAAIGREVESTIEKLRQAARPGVEVVVTRDFLSKPDLIRWCARNTLNAFLYDRAMTGLAATTDQAITSGRPLAVSGNETFRHLHPYLIPYPMRSLRESIERSGPEVAAMQQAWSPARFRRAFEELLDDLPAAPAPQPGPVTLKPRLPLLRLRPRLHLSELVPPALPRIWRLLNQEVRRRLPALAGSPEQADDSRDLQAFASPLLGSFSGQGEDLWLDLLLGSRPSGVYVEVGGTPGRTGSHSFRFYQRGWSGVTVEPEPATQAFLARQRPRDCTLQAELGARFPLARLFDQQVGERSVDFLAVDAGGDTCAILASHDWARHRPTLVLARLRERRDAIVQLLQRQDYALLLNNPVIGLFVDLTSSAPPVRALLADRAAAPAPAQPTVEAPPARRPARHAR
jgi:hypothetical protein